MADDGPRTLMLVGAHHDDNELMAGTVTRHLKAGWRVVSVVATAGRSSRGALIDANIEIRNEESRQAAKLLGMEPVFLGLKEGDFHDDDESCRVVTAAIRMHQPKVVVTHPPLDYHADHMAVSRCVLEATYRVRNKAYECGEPAVPGLPPKLYYSDAWFVPFEPDVYIDVSDYIDLTVQALACHKSQLAPEGPTEGDMIDMAKTRARFRGNEAGFGYAEAFRYVPRLHRVRTAELLE